MQNKTPTEKELPAKHSNRRTALFIVGLVGVALLSYSYKILNNGIFACSSTGYSEGWFLAYCNSTAYGDYDHGALWYQSFPDVERNAKEADVLFVGSSRMQYGFSTEATENWFAKRQLSHYLLGFSHTETVQFTGPLLDKIKPDPKVLVINVDGFFEDRVTEPAATIMAGGDARTRYNAKFRWQRFHHALCSRIATLCGSNPVVYRKRDTGKWQQYGDNPLWKKTPTAEVTDKDEPAWGEELRIAREFLKRFDIDSECVVLTVVPSPGTPMQKARWLAQQLNVTFAAPTATGFRTRDNSHLNEESAERWSQLFFEQADGPIRKCLSKQNNNASAIS